MRLPPFTSPPLVLLFRTLFPREASTAAREITHFPCRTEIQHFSLYLLVKGPAQLTLATRLQLDDRGTGVRSPAGTKHFYILHGFETGSEDRPIF